MSEYIEVRSMEEVAYLLNVLFTNLNNLDRAYYDIFINPEPMIVNLERYDETGTLTVVPVPNRAMDRITSYSGEGNPNGVVKASTGAFYIDLVSKELFYKGSGSDAYGWLSVYSSVNLDLDTEFLKRDGDASELHDLNVDSVTSGKLPVRFGGTGRDSIVGLIKGNGTAPFESATAGVDYLLPTSFVGLIAFYPAASIPTGWLPCNGASVNKTDYPILYSAISDKYGTTTDESKFKLPDLREYFIQGWNGNPNNIGVAQEGSVGAHTHTFSGTTSKCDTHTHGVGDYKIKGRLGGLSYDYEDSRKGITDYKNNCFSWESGSADRNGAGKGTDDKWVYLNANSEKGFSGKSAAAGAHTHTVSGTTGSTGSARNLVRNVTLVPIIKADK